MYCIVFVICYLITCIGELDKRNGLLYYICISISVCILIIFAGLRDDSVGADTTAYPVEVFEFVQFEHSFEEISVFSVMIEPLYVLLGYVTTKFIANNFYVWLTVCHSIILVPLFIGAVRMRRFIPVSTFTLFFCFLFFNATLNIQRQWMAVGIVYLGFTYLLFKRNVKQFIIYIIIAFCFHRSAVFALIFIPIFYMRSKIINRWLIRGSLLFLVAYNYLLDGILTIFGMEKYRQYASEGEWETSFSISEFVIRIFFFSMLLSLRRKNRSDLLYNSAISILLIEFVLNMLQIWSQYMGRLGIYAYILYLPFLSYYINMSASKIKKHLYYSVWLAIAIGYWWFVFVEKNAGFTNPYKSVILGLS